MIHNLRFRLFVFFIIISSNVLAQQPTNTDPSKSYVNVNIPRTPEAAGFEKYGITTVNEFAGTPNISIPIYNLKSRFLQAPLTLNYQPGGIKVNQEASWVGLGWDLNVGGRITVETRGSVDFCGSTNGLFSKTTLASGMQTVFNRLGNSRENAVLTEATLCEGGGGCPPANTALPGFDIVQAVQDMTQYGAGEPDIFRANFMGHSLTFFVDKISNSIKFIGEQSLFSVTYTTDSYNNITGWVLKDNDGITYYFSQTETTTNTLPGSAIIPATTTTAWLLTSAVHPSGDYIQFTYNNYGLSVPAFNMNASINWPAYAGVATVPNDQLQNLNLQSSYYLTRAETADIAVDFTLDTRTDFYGPGSRKLTQIKVTDKLTNTVGKTATFNYSYFQGTVDPNSQNYLNSLFYYLPSGLYPSAYLACSNSRLRLDAVNVNDNMYEPPYQFYYNTGAGVPDKYSLSQDHWGYYNGVDNRNNGYSFSHLIPYSGLGGVGNIIPATALSGSLIGNSRDCDANLMQAMMLNKIVYPTGGSTEYTYEPHQSTMTPTTPVTGGGLRVKIIKNFAVSGTVASSTEYSYTGGKYMGNIRYFTTANVLNSCSGMANNDGGGSINLSSNGAINYNDILIGYAQITITQKDRNGLSNGYVQKNYNINVSSSNYSNNSGYDFDIPYMPQYETIPPSGTTIYQGFLMIMDPSHKSFPPTPSCNLEGKLIYEQTFDNSNSLLKSVNYYYHLANYSNNFYDVRAIQNRADGFNYIPCGYPSSGMGSANRPVILFVSPAKSYHTLTDSIVETNYSNGNSLISRKYFTYDSYYQTKTQTEFNSDGTPTVTTYGYPYDFVPITTTPYGPMMGAHMYSTVISTNVTKNGAPVYYAVNNYYNPSSGVYVPQNTQIKIGGNALETREQYNGYDTYGHLLERQKPNGVKETYLWGYDSQFPVAKVVGSDYTTVSGLVNSSTLNAPPNDATLRAALSNLRGSLPNAMVTTYTYNPVFGISSQTDPNGRNTYYEYDAIGRLNTIRDHDLNIIKKYDYQYQVTALSSWNALQSGTYTRNNCGSGYTGGTYTTVAAANTFSSSISVADANQKAINYVASVGQSNANTYGVCSLLSGITGNGSNSKSYSFSITFTNTVSGASYSFSIFSGSQVFGTIPPGTYNINIFDSGPHIAHGYLINSSFNSGVVGYFYNMTINSYLNVTIY